MDVVVDEAGVATPTNEWMEAAQRAVDTDGILENGPAKRQKVCNSCNTLTALHLQTLHKNAPPFVPSGCSRSYRAR